MAQSVGWCFTLNNPETNEIAWPAEKVRYAIWQREAGENGTPHLQGYMEFKRGQRMSALKKILPRAHLEPRRGTREQAKAYASKEDTRVEGPWEFGKFDTEQGARTDLETVAAMVKDGETLRKIAEEQPVEYIKYNRGISALKAQLSLPRTWKTKVIVRWGEPGSGKTRWVYDTYKVEEVFVKPPGDWYDGYDGQEVVLIDDFYGNMKYAELLRVLDRYPMMVPVKGGFVNWAPKVIIITSNNHPEGWYENIADKRALLRRIEEIHKVGDAAYGGHAEFFSPAGVNEIDEIEPSNAS